MTKGDSPRPKTAEPVDVEELSLAQTIARLKIKSVGVLVSWCAGVIAACLGGGFAIARFLTGQEVAAAQARVERLQTENEAMGREANELRKTLDTLKADAKMPTRSAVTLVSFALNENESYYTATEDFDPLVSKYIHSWEVSPRGEAIISAFYWSSGHRRSASEIDVYVHDRVEKGGGNAADARYFAGLFGGGNAAAQQRELSKMSPVFDATILNRGGSAVVLTHVQIEVLNVWYAEEGGEEAPPPELPRPLEVLHRYAISLDKIYNDQYRNNEWPREELGPPIYIPNQQAARVQLQFHLSYLYARYVRFRVRFILNGHDEISSPVVSVFFGKDWLAA